MSRSRWLLLLGIAALSGLLAYLLRDAVYQLIIVPLAYLWWLARFYYSAAPQWILWSVLLGLIALVVLWNLLPQGKPASRKEHRRGPAEGQVEALTVWIMKARRGNYFKWQLANRLGLISRRLAELSGPRGRLPSDNEAVEKYFDAGLNYSFVDFLGRGRRFERRPRTPLDLDPRQAADYLESQMEHISGQH